MQSLFYSFALSLIIVSLWFIQIVCTQSYNILEITAPPSAYGPPHVYLRSESTINNIKCSYETYDSRSSQFINQFRIFKGSIDEVRIFSNLPPNLIDQLSARLLTPDGVTIARWNHDIFQAASLEISERAYQFPDKSEDVFAASTRIETPAWHILAEGVPWLKLLLLQIVLSISFYTLFRFLPLYRASLRRLFNLLGQVPFFARDIARLNLAASCLLAVIFISMFIWQVFGIYYGTVDDPFMTLIAKGYLMDHPDWHLFFIHPFIGFILVHLYREIPHVPWYVLCMVSIKTLSISMVVYALMRRSLSLGRIILCLIMIFVSGIYTIACVQFTIVSTMACLAGMALILGNAGNSSITKIRLIAAIGFFLIGAAVRIHPAVLLIVLIGPCAFYLWCKGLLPGIKCFLVAIFVGVFFLNLTERAAYQVSPEWSEAKSYDKVRGMLQDTQIMKEYSPNADVFRTINWSQNDLLMFNNFIYEDANVYSKEKLTYLVTHLQHPPFNLRDGLWTLLSDFYRNLYIMIFYLIWLIFILNLRLMPFIQTLSLVVPCMATLCYLAIGIRLPERVLSPIMFAELAILLLLADFNQPKIKLRSALFGSIFMLLLCCDLLSNSFLTNYARGQYSNQRQHSTIEALMYLSALDTPIIVNPIGGVSADETSPWEDFPELKNIRILQLAWFESPVYNQRLKRLGIRDVFRDLTHRPDLVFAVTRWDLNQVIFLETFLHEHDGLSVKFEVAKIPGTDKDAVFPFFSLFKAKIDSGS